MLLTKREWVFIELEGPRNQAALSFEYATGSIWTDFKIDRYGAQILDTYSGAATGFPNTCHVSKTTFDLTVT